MKPETPTKGELELTIRRMAAHEATLHSQLVDLKGELRIANQAAERILGMASRMKDERDQARNARDVLNVETRKLMAKLMVQLKAVKDLKAQVAELKKLEDPYDPPTSGEEADA